MAPKGYEAVCQTEPSDIVHGNDYQSLDEYVYDGNEWDDCRSGRRSPLARYSIDQNHRDECADPGEWDKDYSNVWDYASLADQARRRSGTVSSSGSSFGTNSTGSSPATQSDKIFDATEVLRSDGSSSISNSSGSSSSSSSSSITDSTRSGGFWGFFGKARTQESKAEPLRGASA